MISAPDVRRDVHRDAPPRPRGAAPLPALRGNHDIRRGGRQVRGRELQGVRLGRQGMAQQARPQVRVHLTRRPQARRTRGVNDEGRVPAGRGGLEALPHVHGARARRRGEGHEPTCGARTDHRHVPSVR